MSGRLKNWLSYAAVVAYGLVAVIGFGLHELAPHTGNCCPEITVEPACCLCGHEHAPAEEGAVAWRVDNSTCSADSGGCAVCELLAQVHGSYVAPPAAPFWSPVITAIPAQWSVAYDHTPHSDHAPRGPPRLA